MFLKLYGKILIALWVAIATLLVVQAHLLFEPPVSSAAGIDGTASRYLVGLIWTVLVATASGVARLLRLWSLRDTHRLSKPAWVEQFVRVGVLGGGAAGGSLAIVAALQRDLVSYAQQDLLATPQTVERVLWMGLPIAFFALWALAYTVGEAVLKPPETDSAQ